MTTNIDDQRSGAFLQLLKSVDRPGVVCTSGDVAFTLPGLHVDDVGLVGLPLTPSQATELIAAARQAPYGKGTETVVDTDVRRVWEIDPSQLSFENSKWKDVIVSITADVQAKLGLTDRKLTAELYQLLLYEEGGFFLPHRDGEKLPGMVATLIVALPAVHEGGELVVRHEGKTHEVVFKGAASGHELSFAAFYADCQHEIKPITTGLRLCLTYNLTLAKAHWKKKIAAPSYGGVVTKLAGQLREWGAQPDAEKIAFTLSHQYTQQGLCMNTLKGVDRARAEVLFQAASAADCIAYLALVTLWESGAADEDFEYSRGRRSRRSWSNYDDESNAGRSDAQHTMLEVYDESLSAKYWTDYEGNAVQLDELYFDPAEIIGEKTLGEGKPDDEEFEGYTGNAGMTLERWYHRAAIVIWPRSMHFHVLCSMGVDGAVAALRKMIQGLAGKTPKKRQPVIDECRRLATAILDKWPSQSGMVDGKNIGEVFAELLCELDDALLMKRFLTNALPLDIRSQVGKSFPKFARKHGWPTFEDALLKVIDAGASDILVRNAELLKKLCAARDKNADRIAACGRLAERFVHHLIEHDAENAKDWRSRNVNRSAILQNAVKGLLAIDAENQLNVLLEHALNCELYDFNKGHLQAIFDLESQLGKTPLANKPITEWLAVCRSRLEQKTATPPTAPVDFQRPSKLPCKCKDCKALSDFLANPNQERAQFPLAKDRRQHLHQMIDANGCDCTHETTRVGRPFTLVCVKTTGSYNRAQKIYAQDEANLKRVKAIEKRRK